MTESKRITKLWEVPEKKKHKEEEIVTHIKRIDDIPRNNPCSHPGPSCSPVPPIPIDKIDPSIIDKFMNGEMSMDQLKRALAELFIRFDTNPCNYVKGDYMTLMVLLCRALPYLFASRPESVITTEWADPLRDDYIPSEKLTKETIDKEVQDRQQADQNLYDDLFPLIAAGL